MPDLNLTPGELISLKLALDAEVCRVARLHGGPDATPALAADYLRDYHDVPGTHAAQVVELRELVRAATRHEHHPRVRYPGYDDEESE